MGGRYFASWMQSPISSNMTLRVLVLGVGDVGSAIAHRLYSAGLQVILHDDPAPTYPRRGMSFTDALFDGHAALEGVRAMRIDALSDLAWTTQRRQCISISAAALENILSVTSPDVLIDARMRKQETPASLLQLAPLTIGIGPGFAAGINCHLAIESQWGPSLGSVIAAGATASLAGTVREIEG